jgi:type II secretory pathway pseudopilin PulG
MRMPRQLRGLTLVEALLLLVIVSIVAVAAGVGLQAVVKVPSKTDDTMAINNVLVSALEQMKAQLTSSPGWPSTTSTTTYTLYFKDMTDSLSTYHPSTTLPPLNTTPGVPWSTTIQTPPTGSFRLGINSKPYQLFITLAKADPTGGANYQSDYLSVTAQLNGLRDGSTTTMVTYVTQP